ncbi:hypothetical protein AKJ16_DCAP01757 [Drosera capensis]
MAECSTVPSNFNSLTWQPRNGGARATQLRPHYSFSKNIGRNSKVVPLSSLHIRINRAHPLFPDYATSSPRKSLCNCNCLGTLVDSEIVAASDWITVTDQVLLLASVILTYMAGVIPSKQSLANTSRKSSREKIRPDPTILVSMANDSDGFRSTCLWDIVRDKLKDSLKAIGQGNIVESTESGLGKNRVRQPLSLFAISEVSRIQLLSSSLEQLEEQVSKPPEFSRIVERAEWLTTFSTIIQKTSQSACISWMEKELIMKNCTSDRAVIRSMSEKLTRDDCILRNISRLGKVDLYADLLYLLKFDSLRGCGHYDQNLFELHGISVLEDLVTTLADGIASIYLECISVDSDISDKLPNLVFTLCSLSTRALQKLRNEVAMKQWFHENVEAVVSMYEDRFDLCTLQNPLGQEPIKNGSEENSWIKKLFLQRSVIAQPQQQCFVVSHFSLTVKRTKELRALSGWKYYLSLALELSDILTPLVTATVAQIRNAISFFLMSLIGRSLGLIYTGIRQSLRWK